MAAEGAGGSRRYAAEGEYMTKELDDTPSFCNAFWVSIKTKLIRRPRTLASV